MALRVELLDNGRALVTGEVHIRAAEPLTEDNGRLERKPIGVAVHVGEHSPVLGIKQNTEQDPIVFPNSPHQKSDLAASKGSSFLRGIRDLSE